MTIDYSKYFETRINQAKNQLQLLDENEIDPAILLANINGVRNIIFEILDYTVNHFPSYMGNCRDLYFPILKLGECKDSLGQNMRFQKLKTEVSGEIDDYINKAYDIILSLEYDNCLLLLDESSKHRNSDQINEKKPEVKAKYQSFGGPEVTKNIYGGFNIGKFFNFGAGNCKMSNCIFSEPNGVTIIESIETIETNGNSLLIKKGEGKIRVLIKPFLEKSIKCCKEIINLWSSYLEKE